MAKQKLSDIITSSPGVDAGMASLINHEKQRKEMFATSPQVKNEPYPNKNPLPSIIATAKKVLFPEIRPMTPQENESAKQKGERAFFEAKIKAQEAKNKK